MKLKNLVSLPDYKFAKQNTPICEVYRFNGWNDAIQDIGEIDIPEPNTELDHELLAKELFEVCCYPDPTKWEDCPEDERSVWLMRASIIGEKFGTQQSKERDIPSKKQIRAIFGKHYMGTITGERADNITKELIDLLNKDTNEK